jgi:hypothetical protein
MPRRSSIPAPIHAAVCEIQRRATWCGGRSNVTAMSTVQALSRTTSTSKKYRQVDIIRR